MTAVFIVVKIFLSLFLLGILIGGLIKLSPAHRNSERHPGVEKWVGIIGLCFGLAGLYITWFN